MSQLIAIASGKGGVGKTFVTATLALALARQGWRVLAVDADMGLRNLDLPFGLQDDVLYDMGDVMKKQCRLEDAILHVTDHLDFLAASQKHTWEKIDGPTYQYIVETAAKSYDYVLIDCPPGRGRAYKQAVAIADRMVFVIEPTWSSMRDTARLMQYCNKHKQFHYDVLFNNFYRHDPGYVSIDEMLDVLTPEQVAGILPHDPVVHEGSQTGTLVDVTPTAPLFQAEGATIAYLTEGKALPIDELVALLPAQEIRPEQDLPAEDDREEIAEPTRHVADAQMKAAAAAELAKAAAIWQGKDIPETTPDTDDAVAVAESPSPEPSSQGLSLRKRQQQSMAWRLYRR